MGYFEDHLLPSEKNAIPYIPVMTEYLDFICEKYSGQIALSDPEQAVGYSELADRVARRRQVLCRCFSRNGIRSRQISHRLQGA